MKKILLFIYCALCCACSGSIYVCNGPSSHAYHKDKNCMGLRHCSTNIEQISKEEAEAKGRHLCSFEK